MPDIVETITNSRDLLSMVKDAISAEEELVISKFFIDMGLPITYVYDKPINPDLMPPDLDASISPGWFAERAGVIGTADFCKMHFSIYNRGTRPASIRGVGLRKHRIPDPQARGCMEFIPDGAVPGEPIRLRCLLDANHTAFTREDICPSSFNGDGEDYFRHGRVEIDPGHTQDFVITLVAKKHAYRCSLYLRAESVKAGTYVLEPEGPAEATVVPVALIPEAQRFASSQQPFPPYVMHWKHH